MTLPAKRRFRRQQRLCRHNTTVVVQLWKRAGADAGRLMHTCKGADSSESDQVKQQTGNHITVVTRQCDLILEGFCANLATFCAEK